MNSPNFRSIKVKELRRQLVEGCFAVPKLQRAFVWNGNKAAKLLDSVYKGMPIGSLTIWDTSKKNKDILRHTPDILPPFQERNRRVLFILDGQQRLSVLHQVAIGGERQNRFHKVVDFDRVVFRVTDGDEESRFDYRRPVQGEWVSMPDVLASNWRSRLKHLTPGQLNRVERCRTSLRDYKVPIVQVTSENMDETREMFIRINSQGTPLGSADRAFARASKFDLRERAEDMWQHLPTSFQGIRNEMLLQTRALLDEINDVGERAFEEVAKLWDERIGEDPSGIKRFTREWDDQRRATDRAIDCLRHHFRVLDDGLLPSQYMLATLAVFFYYRKAQPTAKQLGEIRKWFWATAVGQRYSGRGFRENILKDAALFRKLGNAKAAGFVFNDRVDVSDLQRTTYGQRSSIADAVYCLLISHQPAYLSNGHAMQVEEYASPANRKHKHHIFPKALLARSDVPTQKANSVVNLCFISGGENSAFGSQRPRAYLNQFRSKRYFAKAMRSHLIPIHAKSGLWDPEVKRGYRVFIKARTREICKAFEKAAGIKLFRSDW